jgi:HAD superfamily hydrolase (TIGR01509 family)
MLVIFDCDGTLVDSEILWARATLEIFEEEELGIEIDLESYNSEFAGMTNAEIIEKLEQEMESSLPHDLLQRIEDRADQKLEQLKVIEGTHDMLDALDYARCVCSNTTSERLEVNMRRTDLWDRFRPYVYSAVEVGTKAPKPDPNVFLHAATSLDVEPKDCFVVEDSFHGVQAAVAAGMRVIGFTGAGHSYPGHGEHLMDAGAETVIRRFKDLPATLEALRNWHE